VIMLLELSNGGTAQRTTLVVVVVPPPTTLNTTANHTMPTLRLTLPSDQQALHAVALAVSPAKQHADQSPLRTAVVAVATSAEFVRSALMSGQEIAGVALAQAQERIVTAVDSLVNAVVAGVVKVLDELQHTTESEVNEGEGKAETSEVLGRVALVVAAIVAGVHLQAQYM